MQPLEFYWKQGSNKTTGLNYEHASIREKLIQRNTEKMILNMCSV